MMAPFSSSHSPHTFLLSLLCLSALLVGRIFSLSTSLYSTLLYVSRATLAQHLHLLSCFLFKLRWSVTITQLVSSLSRSLSLSIYPITRFFLASKLLVKLTMQAKNRRRHLKVRERHKAPFLRVFSASAFSLRE